MSRLSPIVRPVIIRSNSSTSSLNGMEIATPKSPQRKKKIKKNDDYQNAKPLPPTPTLKVPSVGSSRSSSIALSRTPSTLSLSSVYAEEVPPTPRYVPFRRETILSAPKAAYEPSTYRSSTSMVPDEPPSRPRPKRQAKTQAILQRPAAAKARPPESIFSEWKAPKYEEEAEDEGPRIPTPIKMLAQKSRDMQHIAEQHADEYQSILPRRSSTLPDVEQEPYYHGFNSLPAQMSPRITDVVDETLVPHPLRMSTDLESSTSSHFSSSSSELMALREENGDTFKSRAKKAFHSRKHSQEKSAKKRANSNISSKSSDIGESHRIISMTASERASIQKGIIDMYDTLTSLYDPLNRYTPPTKLAPSSRPKPTIEVPPPKKNVLQKDHRSPAIPVTPYPRLGRKAEESAVNPSPSPRSKSATGIVYADSPITNTPKRSHFSLSSKASSSDENRSSLSSAETKKTRGHSVTRSDRSSDRKGLVGVKWKKAVGFDRKKGGKTEGERRREDMKKKIVIIGALTQGPFS